MKRTLTTTILSIILFLASAAGFAWERMNRRKAELEVDKLVQVNDSTQAILARVKGEKDELAALYDAAKALNGKLVAGVKITVPAETVYVPAAETPTQITPDSTRIAEFTDTTEAGYVVTVRGEAPPYPAPLSLGYRLQLPAFEPEVGFVQLNDSSYAAVVSWAGRQYTVNHAFYVQPRKRFNPKGLIENWTGFKSLVEHWELAGGLRWNTSQQSLYGALRRDLFFDTKLSVEAGIGRGNFVGIAVERKFF